MFKKIGKMALLPMVMFSSLSAMEWTDFADIIGKQPAKCFETYSSDLTVKFADMNDGVPSCSHYPNAQVDVAQVTYDIGKKYVKGDKSMFDSIAYTAKKGGLPGGSCVSDNDGITCNAVYNKLNIYWSMDYGSDKAILQIQTMKRLSIEEATALLSDVNKIRKGNKDTLATYEALLQKNNLYYPMTVAGNADNFINAINTNNKGLNKSLIKAKSVTDKFLGK
jgi:hypothetical protein